MTTASAGNHRGVFDRRGRRLGISGKEMVQSVNQLVGFATCGQEAIGTLRVGLPVRGIGMGEEQFGVVFPKLAMAGRDFLSRDDGM